MSGPALPFSPRPPSYVDGQDTEHAFHLERNGHKWISLVVNSPRRQPLSLPIFKEGDGITGRVEVDFEKPENVKAITIQVQAGTTAVGQEENQFLNIMKTLWTPSSGSGSAKLSGRHSWPFNITLPAEVVLPQPLAKGSRPFKLPPNFTEKASPAYIDYRIVITVQRGALRVNQTLSTNFAYLLNIAPDPPSELRQLAYTECQPICGPDLDPKGWKVLPPSVVKGTLFDVQPVVLECTLAIATPLCYAPGSPLPLHLTVMGENKQALDLLAVPATLRLHLVRTLGIGSDAADSDSRGRATNIFTSTVGQAIFWESGKQEDLRRTLEGELEVSSNLKPSFTFPRFTIKYRLEFHPFEATGFRATGPAILVSEEIAVATQQRQGVMPWSNIPPGYKQLERVDYNTTVGFLENGNQRFWHHGH